MIRDNQVASAPAPSTVPDPGGAELRETGIGAVGPAPWGTHFCQFYATRDDLAEIVVPYLRAGLEADELCVWITSAPLGVDDAWTALGRAMPDLESYRRRGRIEIVPHTEWYLLGGSFEPRRVLDAWSRKVDEALARGCAGLRLAGNTAWVERSDWPSFVAFGAALDAALAHRPVLALCTYALERCGAPEVADVLGNHPFALLRRDGRWERFESFDRRRTPERRAEVAPRERAPRVQQELEGILSAQGDVERLGLADLVEPEALQALMDEFYNFARIPMAVIGLDGQVVVGVGWQRVCTEYHRVHPETCRHCIESDTQLTAGVPEGEFKLYRCKNNMWDVATPLVVGGHHVGNVFMGQFFFDDERPDYALFKAQARRYGFREERYLAALDAVPRLSRETVETAMAFFIALTAMLSKLGYGNVRLARAIADREALMSSLRQSKERLEEADRRKDEFLGMLSHELRNPLAPIRSSVVVLDRDPDGERATRARSIIRRQTEHLTRIVDDLLDVTRIARGKIELRRERLDLRDVVGRTGEDHRAILEQRGVAFRVELPAEEVWADADATRVAQVIGNLLQNAAKFTHRGDAVWLALSAGGGAAEIVARDTGVGIDRALLDDVFKPFVQGERTLARSEGGLGLGLALVKGIAELHGGTVRVESRGTGQGAEFVVRLPVVEPPIPAREAPATPRPPAAARRVLVVDDNADGADSLADVVRMLGHVAEVAYDGPTAIEKARANPPDVVLCDVGLPGMSGYELARILRATGARRARLVAVTGYAQPEDLRAAAEAGFDRHLAKPTSIEDLERTLAERDDALTP